MIDIIKFSRDVAKAICLITDRDRIGNNNKDPINGINNSDRIMFMFFCCRNQDKRPGGPTLRRYVIDTNLFYLIY